MIFESPKNERPDGAALRHCCVAPRGRSSGRPLLILAPVRRTESSRLRYNVTDREAAAAEG